MLFVRARSISIYYQFEKHELKKVSEAKMLNKMEFQQNSSVIVCPLERVEFDSQSVYFETGSVNSPLEACLRYGCNFADDTSHLLENFCKCPEDLTTYEATVLEKKYSHSNFIKRNFWEFVALNKGKFKPEIFSCTLEKFSIYSESLCRNDFADCITCKFASEDKANEIIDKAFWKYTLKDIIEICNCPPDMTLDFYEEVYNLYKKKEPSQFLNLEKNFNRKEFQKFVFSDYIHIKKKLKNLKLEKNFFYQDRKNFSKYYLELMKTQARHSDNEFKNIVLKWIDEKNERRLHKKRINHHNKLNPSPGKARLISLKPIERDKYSEINMQSLLGKARMAIKAGLEGG